jgi:hypothetical protein
MVTYRGGTGESLDDAIVIQGVMDTNEGVASEYQYLSEKFGQRGIDWELARQELIVNGEKQFDKLDIRLSNGITKTIYFNITEFFGK